MAELTTPRIALLSLVCGVSAYFVVSLWQGEDAAPEPTGPRVTEMAPERVAELQRAAKMIAELDQTPKSTGIGKHGAPPAGAVLFPDGTWLPAVNGVEQPPPFPGFSSGRDYSPVVRIHTDVPTGMQFYMHASGAVSYVMMTDHYNGETGETTREAAWVVGNPVPTLPLVR